MNPPNASPPRPSDNEINVLNLQIINNYLNFARQTNINISNIIDLLNNQHFLYQTLMQSRNIIPYNNQNNTRNEHFNQYNWQNIFSAMYDTMYENPSTANNVNNANNNFHHSRTNPINNQNVNFYSRQFPIRFRRVNLNTMNDVEIPTRNPDLIGTVRRFGDIINPRNDRCPISQLDFTPDQQVFVTNTCNHIFDNNSIREWMNRNHYCPLCRFDFNSENNHENETGPTLEANNIPQSSENIENTEDNIRDPLTTHLANFLMEHLANDPDFSGNINIDLNVPRRN